MTTNEQLFENLDDEPDCEVDAASDQGYWLEESGQETTDRLITWRKEAGMSPELLSQMALIPLEEYLLIENGERIMTNGDAWRIYEAIIRYRVSQWTWYQRNWARNRSARNRLKKIFNSEMLGALITVAVILTVHFVFLRPYVSEIGYVLGFFIGTALSFGLPACLFIWLLLYIVKELRNKE